VGLPDRSGSNVITDYSLSMIIDVHSSTNISMFSANLPRASFLGCRTGTDNRSCI
jgi:hypothetical protein